MNKTCTLIFLLFQLTALNAFAYDAKGPWTKTKQIYTSVGNDVFIYFEADAMPGCYGNNGGYIRSADPEGMNRVYSILVAALMANRDVQVYYDYVSEDQTSWKRCDIVSVYVR